MKDKRYAVMKDKHLNILTEKMNKEFLNSHPSIWMIVIHGIALSLLLPLCVLLWCILQLR
jgi:hypothetical protein